MPANRELRHSLQERGFRVSSNDDRSRHEVEWDSAQSIESDQLDFLTAAHLRWLSSKEGQFQYGKLIGALLENARTGQNSLELKVEDRGVEGSFGFPQIGLIDEQAERRVAIVCLSLPDLAEILSAQHYKMATMSTDQASHQTIRISW